MKKFSITLIACWLFHFAVYCQKDSIIYFVPKTVEERILKELRHAHYKANENTLYVSWYNQCADTVQCFLYSQPKAIPHPKFIGARKIFLLVNKSNRFVKIGKYYLRIVFDSDINYSNIGRNLGSDSGYGIRFNFKGDYIEELY